MKVFVFLFAILSYNICTGQSQVVDSLHKSLRSETHDTTKAILLYNLSYYYQIYKPDSALQLAQAAYALSQKIRFPRGISNSLGQMAGAFNRLGNYTKALEYYIEQLKIEEKQESMEGIASTELSIALVYNSEKDTRKALAYAMRADSIARKYKLTDLLLYTSLNIGDIYSDANELDSARKYTVLCYDESLAQKNDLITGTALNNLGNIDFRSGDSRNALGHFKRSIAYLERMQDYNTLAECKLGMARVYQKLGVSDSALYFAKQSFALASEADFLKHALNSSALVSQLYKQNGMLESAFAFQETQLALKDSFDNRERIKQLQNITISEQLRQKEIATAKERAREERRIMLQFLAIGISIPIFFFFSAFLSRRSVSEKVISFSGVFSLLLLFEYIILLVHPVVAEMTHHTPIFEIIIFVAIAPVLTPAHHKIEHWLLSKLSFIHRSHQQHRLDRLKKKQEEEKVENQDSSTITVEAAPDPL